ncbi:MAG: dihydroorotase [Deltaproteobacteria bacterium]|nr:dihydroorotase [Candidatus Zymogenaceae bacterium]
MKLLLKGGTVVDPGGGQSGPADVLIENGVISDVLSPGAGPKDADVIDVSKMTIIPGVIDIHTHLREPGFEYKETVASGTRAAAAGGVTSVACMANTDPVNDNGQITEYILEKAETTGVVRVYPVGAVSRGLSGEVLAEIGELAAAGVCALSDDGHVISNSDLMRRGMEYAVTFDLPVISHSEDMSLVADGVMNEGFVSTELGLPANPPQAEEIMIFRDVTLAQLTGARLHVAHISTAGGVEVIRRAKERGVAVTAETCPHYFTLTDDAVRTFDTNTKVNPPLRSEEDRRAVIEGLKDGTIDVIASDHAPHDIVEKAVEFSYAASGISGLETLLSLSLQLVRDGEMTLFDVVEKLTIAPARTLGLAGGTLATGVPADLTIVDTGEDWTVDPRAFFSKGKNSPFAGRSVPGRVKMTIVAGSIVYREGAIV